jgi:glycogen debranching enzyme
MSSPSSGNAESRGGFVPADTALMIRENATSLVEGSSFCTSEPSGDIEPEHHQGLFISDTRVISMWRLLVDGVALEPLATLPAEPFESTFIGRAAPRPGHDDATIIVERRRLVGAGMREDITVRNFGTETAGLHLTIEVDADFADLFEVKEGRKPQHRRVGHHVVGSDLVFSLEHAGTRRGVRVSAPGSATAFRSVSFQIAVPAQQLWTTTIEVLPIMGDTELEAAFPTDRPITSAAASRRMQLWREEVPRVTVADRRLQLALSHSERDLGALRIMDPDHPEDAVVAAGAPWFMALFGRDSLLTSWMAISLARGALGTLRTLARFQGRRVNPMTEEEPGRILHEVRLGMDLSLHLGGQSVYYGTVDATPLFVMLVDEALRWGAPQAEIDALMPAVDAGLDWMRTYADSDGDGFLEYKRSTDRGLVNQGWKDSHDAVSYADGDIPRAPIAVAEVQGYAYAAYRARAHLADVAGDAQTARTWSQRAALLSAAFDEAFWMPELNRYAFALDHDKRQVDALVSNMGHCLWSGIARPERACAVADALLGPDLFTGFGIRTLGSTMRAFNPVSYHNGSVWPHDTTISADGLARYGLMDHAMRVIDALLDASVAFGGRLPELFCGFDRQSTLFPVRYPTACTPQAWAAASPFQMLRTVLQLEPCVPHGIVHAMPVPDSIGHVRMEGIALGGRNVTIDADTTHVRFEGLPEGMRAVTSASGPPCTRHPS